mmetsp:Transcript_81588/g.264325  ORF Transcript_81588/g.264325 Transcript_81588/m.264325 type:complete len:370 (-) Transcript_81588:942-2051(-)
MLTMSTPRPRWPSRTIVWPGKNTRRLQLRPNSILNCWSNSLKRGNDCSLQETVGSRCREMMLTNFLRKLGMSVTNCSTLSWRISQRLQRLSACTVAERVGAMPSMASSPKTLPTERRLTLCASARLKGFSSRMGPSSPSSPKAKRLPATKRLPWMRFTKTRASPEITMNMEFPFFPSSMISSPGMKMRSMESALSCSTNSRLMPSKKGARMTSAMRERRKAWSMSVGGTPMPQLLAWAAAKTRGRSSANSSKPLRTMLGCNTSAQQISVATTVAVCWATTPNRLISPMTAPLESSASTRPRSTTLAAPWLRMYMQRSSVLSSTIVWSVRKTRSSRCCARKSRKASLQPASLKMPTSWSFCFVSAHPSPP